MYYQNVCVKLKIITKWKKNASEIQKKPFFFKVYMNYDWLFGCQPSVACKQEGQVDTEKIASQTVIKQWRFNTLSIGNQ
jgi:hypothetical protein